MIYTNTNLMKAIHFAAMAHDKQFRKDESLADHRMPYISHPFMVASILAQHEYAEEVVIAGLLHDVIEDTRYKAVDIKERFGSEISALVLDVTEDKTLPALEMKLKYIEHVITAPVEAKAISAADLLANRLSMLEVKGRGGNPFLIFKWTPEKMRELDALRLKALEPLNNALYLELQDAVMKVYEQ